MKELRNNGEKTLILRQKKKGVCYPLCYPYRKPLQIG